jgi:hypothetical protein
MNNSTSGRLRNMHDSVQMHRSWGRGASHFGPTTVPNQTALAAVRRKVALACRFPADWLRRLGLLGDAASIRPTGLYVHPADRAPAPARFADSISGGHSSRRRVSRVEVLGNLPGHAHEASFCRHFQCLFPCNSGSSEARLFRPPKRRTDGPTVVVVAPRAYPRPPRNPTLTRELVRNSTLPF